MLQLPLGVVFICSTLESRDIGSKERYHNLAYTLPIYVTIMEEELHAANATTKLFARVSLLLSKQQP